MDVPTKWQAHGEDMGGFVFLSPLKHHIRQVIPGHREIERVTDLSEERDTLRMILCGEGVLFLTAGDDAQVPKGERYPARVAPFPRDLQTARKVGIGFPIITLLGSDIAQVAESRRHRTLVSQCLSQV